MRWVAILIALVGCRFHFSDSDAARADAELPYIETAPGWSAHVFADFSDSFTYVETDFVDGPETYDNLPLGLFVLRAPYSDALAVIAGRKILEVTPDSVISHDFGNHLPNTSMNPDRIVDGVWTPSFNVGSPAVLITSSSDSGGDGLYVVSTQWVATNVFNQNNVRGVAWDDTGAFDARGTPEGYLGATLGVFRVSDMASVIGADTVSIRTVGPQLLIVRRITIDIDERLLLVSSMTAAMYPEAQLAQAGAIRIGDGQPPAPGIAWAMIDHRQLAAVNPTGAPTVIATTTDADARWQDAATPPAGHPLATSSDIVYVLETNRAADRDRVLVFTSP